MNGKMLARGPRFSYADWVLSTAVIDVNATRRARSQSFPDVAPHGGSETAPQNVQADFEYADVTESTGTVTTSSGVASRSFSSRPLRTICWRLLPLPGHPEWETGPHQKEEEFARAVALALFDYLRKSRSQGFVVSLSGGADSSTVAVIVHLLARFGGGELGYADLHWQALVHRTVESETRTRSLGRHHESRYRPTTANVRVPINLQ